MAHYAHQPHPPRSVVQTYQDHRGLQQQRNYDETVIKQYQMYRDPAVQMQIHTDQRIPQTAQHKEYLQQQHPIYCSEDTQQYTVHRASYQEENPQSPEHQSLVCDMRSKMCNSNSDIVSHFEDHVIKRTHAYDVYDKGVTLNANLQKDRSIPTENESYVYEHCNKSYRSKRSLWNHKNIYHKRPKLHVCNICRERFSNRWHLIWHSKIHTGKLDPIYTICFNEKPNLRSHCRTYFSDWQENLEKNNVEGIVKQEDQVISELEPLVIRIIEAMIEEKQELIQVQSGPNRWWINYTGTSGYEEHGYTKHEVHLDDYVQAFDTIDQPMAHVLRQGLTFVTPPFSSIVHLNTRQYNNLS